MQEIVIKINDIPKNDHERWVKSHGTPLPKGHGRLIDADALMEDVKKHYFDDYSALRCIEIPVNNAPTILETDKEN